MNSHGNGSYAVIFIHMTPNLHRKDSLETGKSMEQEPVDSLTMCSSIDLRLLIFFFSKQEMRIMCTKNHIWHMFQQLIKLNGSIGRKTSDEENGERDGENCNS